MINSKNFLLKMFDNNVTAGAGVPCSFLSGLINAAINSDRYEAFNNEGDALAYASGWSAGRKDEFGFCLMQNSGLSNALSPLTSLNPQFKIPVLLFVSWRGCPGIVDEPQHSIMSTATEEFLKASKCKYEILSTDEDEAISQLNNAVNYMREERLPYAFVVRKGTFSQEKLLKDNVNEEKSSRNDLLKVIDKFASEKSIPIVCTTGQTGRELHDLHDSDDYLYMVGSMGCGQALSAGLSKSLNRKIIFVDGDGALLMRAGSCVNVAHLNPEMIHIVVVNGSYQTTGNQSCVSKECNLDFHDLLKGLGYKRIYETCKYYSLETALKMAYVDKGLTAIIVKCNNVNQENLGRPKRSPSEKLEAFRSKNV